MTETEQQTNVVAPATEPHTQWFYAYDQELEVLKAYSNRGAVQTMHVPKDMLERLYFTLWGTVSEVSATSR